MFQRLKLGGFAGGGNTTPTTDLASILVNPTLDQITKAIPKTAITPPPKPQPKWGGYSYGGLVPQRMASGGTSTYGMTNIPMLPVGQAAQMSYSGNLPSYAGSPYGSNTPSYVASINNMGTPSITPQAIQSSTPAASGAAPATQSSPQPQSSIPNLLSTSDPEYNDPQAQALALDLYNIRSGYKKGGSAKMAEGGLPPMSDVAPWYTKREASGEDFHGSGLFNANSGGRTDVLNKIVPAGAYVMPADVVSGLGEGNTMAGANVLDHMMHSLPHGIMGGGRSGGRGIPRAPAPFKAPNLNMNQVKRGGAPQGQGNVPVVVAGGEYLVSPEHVRALGNGNIKNGHRILDHFVVHVRKKTADTMKKLPGPKKS